MSFLGAIRQVIEDWRELEKKRQQRCNWPFPVSRKHWDHERLAEARERFPDPSWKDLYEEE